MESQNFHTCLYPCHRWLRRPFLHHPGSHTTQPFFFFFLPPSPETSRSIQPPTLLGIEEVSQDRAAQPAPPAAGSPCPGPHCSSPRPTEAGESRHSLPGCLNTRTWRRLFLNLELRETLCSKESSSPRSGLCYPPRQNTHFSFSTNLPSAGTQLACGPRRRRASPPMASSHTSLSQVLQP